MTEGLGGCMNKKIYFFINLEIHGLHLVHVTTIHNLANTLLRSDTMISFIMVGVSQHYI